MTYVLKAAETAVEGKVTKQRRKSERERLVRKHIIALSSPLHRLILMIDTSTRALPEDRAPSLYTVYIYTAYIVHSVHCTLYTVYIVHSVHRHSVHRHSVHCTQCTLYIASCTHANLD